MLLREGPYYVDNHTDYNWYRVYWKDENGIERTTNDGRFMLRFFAQRAADRRNKIWRAQNCFK